MPARYILAATLPAVTSLLLYAAVPGHAAPFPSAVVGPEASTPVPTPSCQEWQTVTLVPMDPQPAPSSTPRAGSQPTGIRTTRPSTSSPAAPSHAVCRNAPPTPFEAPPWDPATIVGGPRLAESGVIVDAPATVPGLPEVGDVSYVVADLDSGEILAAKSPHAWLRPASTLKTLTALTLIPRLDPKKVVVATPEQVAANGTRAGMIAGNPYPVRSLFDALLMLSANDAAYGLADAAGGYEKTLALMNAKASEIGAYDTVALDPSGLDEDGQHSSAYDLALISRDAMALKAFRGYITQTDAVFPGGKDAKTGTVYKPFHLMNINPLLGHYPGAIGIKPGRTNRAQHTFIGAANRGGRTLIVSQMGSTSGSWEPTAALLDWGFDHADQVTPVGRLVTAGEATPPTIAPSPSPSALSDAPTASNRAGAPDDSEAVAPRPGTRPDSGTPAPLAAAAPDRTDPGPFTMLPTGLVLGGGFLAAVGLLAGVLVARRRRCRP